MNIEQFHSSDMIDAPDLTVAACSGRATWDERGNSIWEWQTAPGVFSRDIDSNQLHALEARELCLMDGTHSVEPLWSRNARRAPRKPATELVMPMRSMRPSKSGAFDMFLKHLGLPA